ncbi:hypothetical protein BG53_00045 [Paenibacillus darwinianus]|uniref:Putative phosphoesterase BG53_00045 n=1 Tax=Paenibacillus darwinianus TaxID=1380763 RepID=A0A9W5S2X2_9BACL|nr:2'-5' RNA ligase family protein [Paenibacillus darwinianus]EXX91567.1 hypothetical protein BG52_08750 [Paenibacillus darwinianus]EXX92619.1 hypothetical protein BG53_00045 [Paenibacillus darwinianus]EXX92658.1 hypothetical protein CH50_05745 [Paenibacillus darwinianus]
MRYGIAVFPAPEIQAFADSYRKRHDAQYSLIPPHMTLREAEQWSGDKAAKAIQQLESAAQAVRPFTLRFNRISSFYPASHVVYMALEDPEPMTRLHKAVCKEVLALEKTAYVYTPHVTLGRNLSADELHDLYGSLRNRPLDYETAVDAFHLLTAGEDGAWSVYRTFHLTGK